MSGATSPAPRAIARIIPVMMPGSARGRTMRRIVCHFVAPQPYEPSRIEFGTAEIASSVATMTTGSVSSASVSEAHSSPPLPYVGFGSCSAKNSWSIDTPTIEQKNPSPKTPNTMLGTPARLFTQMRTTATSGPGFAYSRR